MNNIYIKLLALLSILIITLVGCSFLHKKTVDVSTKNNWVVTSNPTKIKEQNEFDVIIIGSGIGGLSCGALLAKENYKVLALEQHTQVGGYCSSYNRNGFIFNVGVEDISGLWEHGGTLKLLHRLNLNKKELFVLNTRLFILGDKKIYVTGTKDNFIKELSKNFPNERDSIESFFNEAQKALIDHKLWSGVSYKQKLDEFFKSENIKKFLCSLLGYLGTSPEKTPARSALGACLQYFIYGGYYPKGGAQNFANTLKDFIETHGGQVLTSCKVDKILVDNNHVSGVIAGDKVFKSPIVVANANAKTTFINLVPKGAIDQEFINSIGNLKMSSSLVVVHVGVDIDLSHLPSLINKLDEGQKCHILISSSVDHTTAPDGKANITIMSGGNYYQTPKQDAQEYIKYKDDCIKKAIEKIEKIIPDISKHIIVTDGSTPRSFEKFTSMPEGAIYAFDQSIGKNRPYFKTPLKGLYLASASSHGGGIESVIWAGIDCADDIISSNPR
jgi:all-trans-retinol 13,14-reductase